MNHTLEGGLLILASLLAAVFIVMPNFRLISVVSSSAAIGCLGIILIGLFGGVYALLKKEK